VSSDLFCDSAVLLLSFSSDCGYFVQTDVPSCTFLSFIGIMCIFICLDSHVSRMRVSQSLVSLCMCRHVFFVHRFISSLAASIVVDFSSPGFISVILYLGAVSLLHTSLTLLPLLFFCLPFFLFLLRHLFFADYIACR